MKRSITGIQPTGAPHIGNYLGMINPALKRQADYQCIYFIADMHALNSTKNGPLLQEQVLDLVAVWLACGLDIDKHILYRQSDVPMVAEYAWYLSTTIGMGFLSKGHAYKDASANNRDVSHGVFAYPVLMAADILMYDADIVPVGKDQVQHVEMARDFAGGFNAIYGSEIIKLPEVKVDERVMIIPGLDGRKMSKSYGNQIPLFCDQKTLRQKVMSIKTDSTALEAPKVLKGSLVGDLFSVVASEESYKDLESRMAKGGMGWGHAKEELYLAMDKLVANMREKYLSLRQDEVKLHQVLKIGATKAYEVSLPALNRVRKAIGMSDFTYRPIL